MCIKRLDELRQSFLPVSHFEYSSVHVEFVMRNLRRDHVAIACVLILIKVLWDYATEHASKVHLAVIGTVEITIRKSSTNMLSKIQVCLELVYVICTCDLIEDKVDWLWSNSAFLR